MIKSRFLLIILWAFSIGIFVTVIFNVPLAAQIKRTPLAGNAIIPNEDYNAWLKVQMDSSIADKDKVACTVNTFFNVKYKSWVKLELLDFGFLFDMSDEAAREDYAYERGFYHVMLTAWRDDPITALKSYKYEPKFYQLSITNSEARAKIHPIAILIHKNRKVPDGNTPWTDHDFILVHKNNLWLIKRVTCDDPLHNIYPHGSDFNRIAMEVRKCNQEVEKQQEAEEAKLMKDPRAKQELIRRKNSRKKGLSQRNVDQGWRNYAYGLAANYALLYSSNNTGDGSYNHKFLAYTSDCANFVSQCLWFGFGGIDDSIYINTHALPMINDGVNGRTWWADCDSTGVWNGQYPWINVYQFLSMLYYNYDHNKIGPQGFVGLLYQTQVGEVVSSKVSSHVMIVNGIIDYDSDGKTDFNEIFICAHTQNRQNVQLSTIFPTYSYCVYVYIYGFVSP